MKFKQFVIYLLVPSAVAFLINIKVFFLPNCFGFDITDATYHTFPNLAIACSILRDGQIPMMNMYNNFGTPLMGDSFTYPFGIQSLVYYLLPDYLASTVNRSLFGFLTVALLTAFYRKRFSAPVASTCAVLSFLTPSALWSFGTHHYQLAMMWTTALLLLQGAFAVRGSVSIYVAIFLTWTALLLSTSIHPVLIIVLFTLGYQFFLAKGNAGARRTILFLVAATSAFLLTLPETTVFFRSILTSQRANILYDLSLRSERLWRAVFAGILTMERYGYQSGRWNYHEVMIYFSLPLLTFVVMGMYQLWMQQKKADFWPVLVLGVLPTFLVFVFMRLPKLYWAIPLVKSTDATRLLWFSVIFLMISVGQTLEAFRQQLWSFREILIFELAFLLVLSVSTFFWPWRQIGFWYKASVYALAGSFVLALVCSTGSLRKEPVKVS